MEDKFDGIRAQLHRTNERVEIFSRDLKRITAQFPELAEQAARFDADMILDGEIVAFDQGRKLTFFDLQKRLGRKSDGADLFAAPSADVPVAFVAFDLLWLNQAIAFEDSIAQAAGAAARFGIAFPAFRSRKFFRPIPRLR